MTTYLDHNNNGGGSLSQTWTRTSDSSVPKQPEDTSAYLIELTQDQSSQLLLDSPEDLRQELQRGITPDRKRVVVLHGLPVDFVAVLRDELGLPAGLVEAIAARRTYRPLRRGARDGIQSFEYPELVANASSGQPVCKEGGSVVEGMTARDVLGDPPRHSISTAGDQVLFCRASIMVRERASVIFLDRSVWNSSSSLQKAHRPFAVTKACACADEKKHSFDLEFTSKGEDVESLEQRIRRDLEEDPAARTALLGCISIPAYSCWLDLFDALSDNLQSPAPELQALYAQMLRSLEKNIEEFRYIQDRDRDTTLALADWQALLARVDRRLRTITTSTIVQATCPPSESKPDTANKKESSDTDEKQRSLDRVSYLGGILLPITVTTGILGMSDPFSPADNKFWIFWAVSVPFTVMTLLVIYADSIRTSEVWLEVAGEEPEPSGSEKPSTPQLEEGVPYSGRIAPPLEDESPYGPAIVVHRRFGRFKHPAWKREQLGWVGACKSILQFYQFKGMQAKPPGRPVGRKTATF